MDLCFWSNRTGGGGSVFDHSTHYRGTARPGKYLVRRGHRIRGGAGRLHNARKGWPNVLSASHLPGASTPILQIVGRAHQYQRCIVKKIPCIDIDSSGNSFLAAFQVANATGVTQFLEFWARIKRRFVSENTVLNKLVLVL